MPRLSPTLVVALGLPLLLAHLGMIALTKALQSYSRSRLEVLAARKGRPERADEVAHADIRTERAAETIAVLTGLMLAGLAGATLEHWMPPVRLELLVLMVIALGGLGYVLAGVVGKVFAEPILDVCWPAAVVVRGVAWPFSQGFRGIEWVVERLAGYADNHPRPASVEVEIPGGEEDSEDSEPELPELTRTMVQRAVEFSRLSVSDIMRPSSAIVSLPAAVTSHVAAETFRRSGLSRIPLYGANRDDIVGVLLARDLLDRMIQADDPSRVVPSRLARQAFFVPETRGALELLEDLRGSRVQLAIVLDEYGGVAGLVTMEDLLEQLVGPIEDETDPQPHSEPIKPLGGSRFEVDATMPLEDLNERFGLSLPTEEDFQTVGGLAFHALGRLPEKGTTFRFEGVEFTILDVKDHAIRRIMIDLQPVTSRAGGSEA